MLTSLVPLPCQLDHRVSAHFFTRGGDSPRLMRQNDKLNGAREDNLTVIIS